jgi:hypothetical protein
MQREDFFFLTLSDDAHRQRTARLVCLAVLWGRHNSAWDAPERQDSIRLSRGQVCACISAKLTRLWGGA